MDGYNRGGHSKYSMKVHLTHQTPCIHMPKGMWIHG